ncbi:MAG: FliG C-terminal domain-containing protein, partial [bacterium]
ISSVSPEMPSFTVSKSSKPLDFLAAFNPKKVYWVLRNESSSTIAFILSQLPPAVSQRILSVFPTSQQTEISKYMVNIRQVDNRIVETVAKFIKQELEETDISTFGETSYATTQQSIPSSNLSPTPEKNPSTTASIIISNKKIDFTDISLLKPPDMENLLKLTNKNDWVSALKGIPPEIADKILSLMPQIQAKVIKRELDTAVVSKDEIIKSQRDILFKLKGLVTIGKVKIV